MKVFKFGGASISTPERVKNLPKILQAYRDEKILIVVSAMGKTTNALEKVAESFFSGNKELALQLFARVKQEHLNLLKYTITQQWEAATRDLNSFFTEVEWMLHDRPVKDYAYYYDQVVCAGELLSTTLVSHFLREEKIPNRWVDVRDLIRTDDQFRDAAVDWDVTARQIGEQVPRLFETCNFIITQGFIGSTDENESTTLGREGSDFTAAIFANVLEGEDVTIWKDVEGVMNADPKDFPGARVIGALDYREVIEMAYYGAQVIHPKTIKPLQNRDIPLLVKSFVDPSLPGTRISSVIQHDLPPIIVYKRNQVLITFESRDFSFVEGEPVNDLYRILQEARIKPNLTQNGAISLSVCMDDIPGKLEQVALRAAERFEVQVEKQLTLLTIRHYTGEYLQKLTSGRTIVMQQKTPVTIQTLMRESQSIT